MKRQLVVACGQFFSGNRMLDAKINLHSSIKQVHRFRNIFQMFIGCWFHFLHAIAVCIEVMDGYIQRGTVCANCRLFRSLCCAFDDELWISHCSFSLYSHSVFYHICPHYYKPVSFGYYTAYIYIWIKLLLEKAIHSSVTNCKNIPQLGYDLFTRCLIHHAAKFLIPCIVWYQSLFFI